MHLVYDLKCQPAKAKIMVLRYHPIVGTHKGHMTSLWLGPCLPPINPRKAKGPVRQTAVTWHDLLVITYAIKRNY